MKAKKKKAGSKKNCEASVVTTEPEVQNIGCDAYDYQESFQAFMDTYEGYETDTTPVDIGSVTGIDCSGFTKVAMEKVGIGINRVEKDQAEYATPVSLDQLQPGDMVYYDYDGNGVGHVKMYIGNNQCVEAANEDDGIIISDLYSDYQYITSAGTYFY